MAEKGKSEIKKTNKALSELKVVYVDADKINPNKYNPNRQSEHEFELLLKSMREDGFTQPVIVQKANNEIVDGEHRWRAAQALGMTKIPVVFVDMSKEQMRIATLRHNRARGSEDVELAANVLKDLQELGALDWAQDSLQLDDEEINKLIDDIPAPEALMGEEFEQAWEPDVVSDNTSKQIRRAPGGNVESEVITEDKVLSMTKGTADTLNQREARINAAKTSADRVKIKQEKTTQTLSLMFADEEYKIVKKALGNYPAETVLKWCKQHLGITE